MGTIVFPAHEYNWISTIQKFSRKSQEVNGYGCIDFYSISINNNIFKSIELFCGGRQLFLKLFFEL
jgi:hypothetical protein